MPAMQETRVQSLGWEDLMEKGMTTHSSSFIWRIPWTEEPGGLQSVGSQRDTTNTHTHTINSWDFPGGPGVKTLCFCCRG